MADYTIKENDTSKKIEATLKDVDDVVVDLTGATVVFSMRLRSTRVIKIDNAVASIVSAIAGTVEYQWAAGDTDTPGQYEAEFEVLFGGGLIQTFPNNKHILVDVIGEVA